MAPACTSALTMPPDQEAAVDVQHNCSYMLAGCCAPAAADSTTAAAARRSDRVERFDGGSMRVMSWWLLPVLLMLLMLLLTEDPALPMVNIPRPMASGGVTLRESTFHRGAPYELRPGALRRRYAHLGAMMLTLQGDAHMARRPRGIEAAKSKKSFTQATLVFGSLQLAHQDGAEA